jgi:hypothetical protein
MSPVSINARFMDTTFGSSVASLPPPTYHPCAIMRENTLKQRLYAGKAALGAMRTFPSPTVVEMLGCLGFDWILRDTANAGK